MARRTKAENMGLLALEGGQWYRSSASLPGPGRARLQLRPQVPEVRRLLDLLTQGGTLSHGIPGSLRLRSYGPIPGHDFSSFCSIGIRM